LVGAVPSWIAVKHHSKHMAIHAEEQTNKGVPQSDSGLANLIACLTLNLGSLKK
jgi:hypothetical protein